jgi:hypothetical protein
MTFECFVYRYEKRLQVREVDAQWATAGLDCDAFLIVYVTASDALEAAQKAYAMRPGWLDGSLKFPKNED